MRIIKFYKDDVDLDAQLEALLRLKPNQLRHFLQHSAYFGENVALDVEDDTCWSAYTCYTTQEDRFKLLVAYK